MVLEFYVYLEDHKIARQRFRFYSPYCKISAKVEETLPYFELFGAPWAKDYS